MLRHVQYTRTFLSVRYRFPYANFTIWFSIPCSSATHLRSEGSRPIQLLHPRRILGKGAMRCGQALPSSFQFFHLLVSLRLLQSVWICGACDIRSGTPQVLSSIEECIATILERIPGAVGNEKPVSTIWANERALVTRGWYTIVHVPSQSFRIIAPVSNFGTTVVQFKATASISRQDKDERRSCAIGAISRFGWRSEMASTATFSFLLLIS